MAAGKGGTATRVLRRFVLSATICGCMGLLSSAWAQQEEDDLPGAPTEEIELEDVAEAHDAVSRAVLATADWLDSFFTADRITQEANQTNLRLGLFGGFSAGDGLSFKLDTNVRIVLPRTRERLHLLLAGETDDELTPATTRPARRATAIDRRQDDEQRDLVTALQYFFQATDQRSISMRTGFRFRDFAPVFFVGPRYRETRDLDPWTARFTGQLRWFTDEGFDLRAGVDFERPLFDHLFFRITPEASWAQEDDGIDYGVDLNLFQPLSPRQALDYGWSNSFRTQPSHAFEGSALRVRYRQTVWQDWLVGEIAPELSFPRDRDYRPTPGIVVGFSVIFGHYGVGELN